MPSMTTSSAPGMAAAVARPPLTPIMRSLSPWMTRAGTRTDRSRAVRSPEATAATCWRMAPAG
jgi:hypothetical protein